MLSRTCTTALISAELTGAQLVEVLPQTEYEDEHLPGAVNIPLKQLDSGNSGCLPTG
jgi:rhodanese-related sulfurtransferase